VRATRDENGTKADRNELQLEREIQMIRSSMTIADEHWKKLRRYPRSRVLWPGKLTLAGATVDCIVLDVSANGARVRADGLPTDIGGVSLELARFGSFAAEMMWRDGSEVGLRFAEPPDIVAALLRETLPAVKPESDAAD
jgi:hypothetical protein